MQKKEKKEKVKVCLLQLLLCCKKAGKKKKKKKKKKNPVEQSYSSEVLMVGIFFNRIAVKCLYLQRTASGYFVSFFPPFAEIHETTRDYKKLPTLNLKSETLIPFCSSVTIATLCKSCSQDVIDNEI